MSTQTAAATDACTFDPEPLLDYLINHLNLKNDAALARALEVAPPVISKIRNRRLAVGATILIAMHELTGMTIAHLRSMMGDRRAKFRNIDAPAVK